MGFRLKSCEFELLCNVLAEIESFVATHPRVLMSDEGFVKSMREIGVPFTPSLWKCGRATPKKLMAYTRAVRRLEEANLLTRVVEGKRDRTTHVKPTEDGIAAVISKLGEQVNKADLLASLTLTEWGQSLAKVLSL